MRHLLFLEKRHRRSDEALLSRVGWLDLLRVLDVLATFLQSLFLRKIPKLVIQRHRFTPMRHRAVRLARSRLRKRLLGLLVLKGMQQCHPFFDRRLHLPRTSRRKIHLAKLVPRRRRQARGTKQEKQSEWRDGRFREACVSHEVSSLGSRNDSMRIRAQLTRSKPVAPPVTVGS